MNYNNKEIETINRPPRTARAVVQHHNAAIHITLHNTPAARPTSHLRCGRKEVRGLMTELRVLLMLYDIRYLVGIFTFSAQDS